MSNVSPAPTLRRSDNIGVSARSWRYYTGFYSNQDLQPATVINWVHAVQPYADWVVLSLRTVRARSTPGPRYLFNMWVQFKRPMYRHEAGRFFGPSVYHPVHSVDPRLSTVLVLGYRPDEVWTWNCNVITGDQDANVLDPTHPFTVQPNAPRVQRARPFVTPGTPVAVPKRFKFEYSDEDE